MKPLVDQNLYEILEVPRDAAPPAIEAAYHRARSVYGPGSLATYTLITSEEAALLTSRIEEAKRTLLDPDARARYDASLVSTEVTPQGRAATNGAAGRTALGAPVVPAAHFPAERSVIAMPPPPSPSAAELAREASVAGEEPAPAADPSRTGAVPVRTPPPIRLEREIRPPPLTASPAAAHPAPSPPVEIPVPEDSQWTGDALRRVREARGITVQQIAERTKVTRHHVENIEAERFSALPAPVYLRGILLSMARELRLDGQKVARAYLERAGAGGAGQGPSKSR